MSLRGLLNRCVFQWFFIRLTKHQEIKIGYFESFSYDVSVDGEPFFKGIGDEKTYQWYSLQYWVIPFSGYGKKFRYLNKGPKFLRITKPKLIS